MEPSYDRGVNGWNELETTQMGWEQLSRSHWKAEEEDPCVVKHICIIKEAPFVYRPEPHRL